MENPILELKRGIGEKFLKRTVAAVWVPPCVSTKHWSVCICFGGRRDCLKLISNQLRRDSTGLPRNLIDASAFGSHRVEHLNEDSQLGQPYWWGQWRGKGWQGWQALLWEPRMCVSPGADIKGEWERTSMGLCPEEENLSLSSSVCFLCSHTTATLALFSHRLCMSFAHIKQFCNARWLSYSLTHFWYHLLGDNVKSCSLSAQSH